MANNLICAESKKSRPFTVIVEGNIGCGKTTFLNYFNKYNNVCVLSEPIDLWRDCRGHNLLGHMYSDPKKWSFTFQSYVQLTMLDHHVLPTKCPVKLMERSIYSARYCFVEKMKRDGLLSKPSAAVIDEWFQWLTKNTPINVDLIGDCGDVKVSDTEELLGRYDSEDENFESIRNQTTPCQERLSRTSSRSTSINEEHPQKVENPHIKLEEFICDVSMDNNDPSGQDKQEFSFTLYDFDGHGKITKDDIAGLVTTIYEAIGSSVKVPHFGSKTIKVKLTVSPEKQTAEGSKVHADNVKNQKIRYKKDINVTIRQDSNAKNECHDSPPHRRRRHHCCKRMEKKRPRHVCCKKEETEDNNLMSDECSDAYSRLSSASSSEDECEHELISDQEQSTPKVRQKRYTKKANSRYTIPTSFLKDIYKQQKNFTKNKKERNRSSSLQRKELLEIIQANMEKNNLSFQTIGKQSAPQENSEVKPVETKHHHKHHRTTTKTESSFNSYINNTQFYVDLASLQNATQLPTSYKYDKLIDAVIGVTNRRNAMNNQVKHNKKHNRLNPECENPVEYQVIDNCKTNEDAAKIPSNLKKSNDAANKKNSKKNQGVTGHTSSPHYLKHRNRQEDQARAMAQVVRWLEQEFSSNISMKNSWEKASEKENNSSKNVERHEHHHIHEHIHHHYHHFQETPLIV